MISSDESERVLILAPIGRDAEVAKQTLEANRIHGVICEGIDALCENIARGAGAALIASEAIPRKNVEKLASVLEREPSWSELPIILFAPPGPEPVVPSFGPLSERHMTILDRPLRVKTLVSATRSALRSRQRQYEVGRLMAALEARVNERDRFLAVLGHELRNPLGAILLASQMRDPADERLGRDEAALIERQAKHLTRLVDDLLELSRVTAGKIVLQRKPVDLDTVIARTLETLRESVRRHGLEVSFDRSAEPVLVDGDPVRLEQITQNLITNAIKYTPSGGRIHITTSRAGDRGVLRVRDTGVGIAPERLTTIFGLFAQAENAIGRSQGGMGIGLSLVRNLVELHGGTVAAHSEGVGKGSEFTVTLPLAAQLSAGNESATARPGHSSTEPRRVIIVEDNPDVRALLQLKIRRLGHTVEAVGDGERGLEKIASFRPHLAIIDLGLPGMNGYEVAERVRSDNGKGVYLVALSGFGQPEDKRRAVEAGFDEHMTKPAETRDIEALLSRIPPQEGADG